MGNNTDRICGIDRYEHSMNRGELVVPVAYLWKRPGAPTRKENLTGALAHGETVTVLDKKQHKGVTVCRVEKDVMHEGQAYPQRGWLRATLLEEEGLKVPGIKAIDVEGDDGTV